MKEILNRNVSGSLEVIDKLEEEGVSKEVVFNFLCGIVKGIFLFKISGGDYIKLNGFNIDGRLMYELRRENRAFNKVFLAKVLIDIPLFYSSDTAIRDLILRICH